MLTRIGIIALIVCSLCFITFPSYSERNKPRTNPKRSTAGAQELTISTTKISQPAGGTLTQLTGRYENAGRLLNLRSSALRMPRFETTDPPPPDRPDSPEQTSESDYYYANSEMSKSDGAVIVETTLEYSEPAQRNVLYITLNSVQFAIDLNAQREIVPVSEADKAGVDAWLDTDDGRLVQQAGIALIQEGTDDPQNDALLTYWLVALMVGDDSNTQAMSLLRNRRKASPRTHHASVTGENFLGRSLAGALCLGSSVSPGRTLFAGSLAPVQCHGCCGPGCYCIPDWFGRPMYATQCQQHDACVGSKAWYHPECLVYLYASMQRVVIFRVRRR